ncbi:MAG: hypothetical protein MJE77_06720 [Proteobacteria bacterium]|nr:hypothetical protein [Pseudomonadota bacterium]
MSDVTREEVISRIKAYEKLLPAIYNAREYPAGFRLKPLDWALEDEIVQRPMVEATIDGERRFIRPIGTMDIEFLSNDIVYRARKGEVNLVENYPCGLKCPGCFSQEDVYGDTDRLLTWQEVMAHLDQARKIGLHSIKFLGPGELFQNPDLFDILEATHQRDLPISIFTKGAELGSDELAAMCYGHLGIKSARHLVARVAEYDHVRILLGFNSFIRSRQDKMVGSYNKTANYRIEGGRFVDRGVSDYTNKRDRALINLVEAGFSDPGKGQRLSLIAAPVAMNQVDEIAAMYIWGARRNIPVIIAPTMESGPRAIGLMRHNTKIDPRHERMVEMMVGVYSHALEEGLTSLARLREDGISSYMGTDPCNQVSNGLFMRLNGQIQLCPGRSDAAAVYGNVRDEPIAKLWVNSPNYRRNDLRNNWCPAKTNGLPLIIQDEVLRRLSTTVARTA